MQINYCNDHVRRATGGFWYAPSIQNSLQAMDVPPIYAPYGTWGFWPNSTVTDQPDTSIAPNSGRGNTVAAAAIASGFGDASPAASPAIASATGQNIGPVTLVAPMPSITQPANTVAATPAPACNSMDAWAGTHPAMAAIGILVVYFLLGGKR